MTHKQQPVASADQSAAKLDFEQRRAIALRILTDSERLTRKAGSLCGQLIADPTPMTEAQAEWFAILAERAGVAIGETA